MRSLKIRYSLRTFLVLIALVACWLGYQLRINCQRQALLAQILSQGGEYTTYADAEPWQLGIFTEFDYIRSSPQKLEDLLAEFQSKQKKISRFREWLGDPPIRSITVVERDSQKIDKQVDKYFPEASVFTVKQTTRIIPAEAIPEDLNIKLSKQQPLTAEESLMILERTQKLEEKSDQK